MERKCIIHIPFKLEDNAAVAPKLRPLKMIKAFERCGFKVICITGNSKERKERIKTLIKSIKQGEKYDFLYSESSTMPTILTDADHIPRHPCIDFKLFKIAKENGIPISLFYRDIYWKFEQYRSDKSYLAFLIGKTLYEYDIHEYKKYIDKLYLPTINCYKYIKDKKFDMKVDALPPGCDPECFSVIPNKKREHMPIKILYVGGIKKETYDISDLINAVGKSNNCALIICCREEEWDKEKKHYGPLIANNIKVVHCRSEDLINYYMETDICSLVFKPTELREIAFPYKSMEYLAYGKPSIVSSNTAIAKYVHSLDIGWTVDYTTESIRSLIDHLAKNREEIEQKTNNCTKTRTMETWDERAKKVIHDMMKDE